MEVKQAVATAKQHVSELFSEEGLRNVGLEEVEFDENQGIWSVTIGFSRPWDTPQNALAAIAGGSAQAKRSYKVVRLRDADDHVVSVRSLARRD